MEITDTWEGGGMTVDVASRFPKTTLREAYERSLQMRLDAEAEWEQRERELDKVHGPRLGPGYPLCALTRDEFYIGQQVFIDGDREEIFTVVPSGRKLPMGEVNVMEHDTGSVRSVEVYRVRGVGMKRGEVRELPGLLEECCPRCGGDHAWCQWVQPGEFGEET